MSNCLLHLLYYIVCSSCSNNNLVSVHRSPVKSYKKLNLFFHSGAMNSVTCSSGSIPEEDGGKLYNSCTVFGPDGELILKHRKVRVHQLHYLTSFVYLTTSHRLQQDVHHLKVCLFIFPPWRFTSLTLTFRGKSASRSPRLWAQATVCQCSKHVSDISPTPVFILTSCNSSASVL